MSEINLPKWAKVSDVADERYSACIEVDSAAAYPAWLELLKVEEIDQYWLETAYQCIKMDVQAALQASVLSPLRTNKPASIHFSRAEEFALTKHPPGKGVHLATKGREARAHYKRLRGSIPFSA